MRRVRPASSTAGSARRRAGGFRRIGRRKWSGSIASAIRVSRLWLELHLAQAASAIGGRCWEGAAQGGAPSQARAAASAGDDAASEPAPAKAGDGSRHAWLEGEAPLDLIVTMDDATGAIYSAFLVEEEGTASTFRALKEVFAEHGLPMILYTGSRLALFPHGQGRRDRPRLTDPGRAGP